MNKNTAIKLLSLLLAFSATAPALADTAARRNPQSLQPPTEKQFPDMNFPDQASGQAAYARLERAGKVKDFSNFYRLSPEEVKNLFFKDKSAFIDKKGRLLFIENTILPNGSSDAAPYTSTIPLSETFLLNSKPNSPRTIYLDFNGHTATGTAWNSSYGVDPINAVPFDTDGVPGSFSNAELQTIQGIWKRVSEDYAAFDVNVTTQEPTQDKLVRSGSTDTTFGMRAVITKNWTKTTTKGDCGCGGFAYVGVFSGTNEAYKPAFVFYDMLGSNEKYVAEAVSHEVGHTLGLNHDGTSSTAYYQGQGTGETGWAPIMGVGYYKNLVQWSKGEYANANNTQDDYLLMQNNGVVFDADDYGNTPAAAASLTPQVVNGLNNLSIRGVLQGPSDVDVFKLDAGAGPLSVNALPFTLAPNADLLISLMDASGNVLMQSNALDTLGTNLSFSIPANGTYYLSVEGTGKPDPYVDGYSKYGSIGQYSVAVSYPIFGGNLAPTARLTASATNGTTPLTVNFSGSGSSDADGSIVSYAWDFGDGTTATGISVSKTYNAAGQFVASLVVTDSGGLRGQTSTTISTTAPVQVKAMSVGSLIVQGVKSRNGTKYANATVTVVDANGNPVPGVSINGTWSGVVSGSLTGTTGSNGAVTFKSASTKATGTFTFTVKSLTATGYTYDSSKNTLTSASVTM